MVDWLKPYISDTCPYCGSKMVEHLNDDGKITNYYCSNIDQCPGHNAAKGEDMMKMLEIPDIGFARCLDIINTNNLTSHIDILKYIPNVKPVKIKTLFRLLCVQGVDKQWVSACDKNNITRLEDLYKLPSDLLRIAEKHVEELGRLITYLGVEQSTNDYSDKYLTIMITGQVKGYKTKEDFVEYLNKRFGKYVRTIHQETKKQSGVDFLIKEVTTNTMGKVETARKAGIPIYTSEDYIELMHLIFEDGSPEALEKADLIPKQ